VKSPASW